MKITKKQFILLIILGFILRLGFSAISYHAGDMYSWKMVGDSIYQFNMSPFLWWGQGPVNLFIVQFVGLFEYLFGNNNNYFLNILRHLPFITGDLLLIIASFLICKKYYFNNRYLYSLIIWFNPIVIYVSSIHGQTENWMLAFTLFSIYFYSEKKYVYSIIFGGLSIGIKYIFIIMIPFLLLLRKRTIYNTILTVILYLIIILLVFGLAHISNVLFFGDYNYFLYLYERIGNISGTYAPNFYEGRFVSTGMNLWGGIYQQNLLGNEGLPLLSFLKGHWIKIFGFFYFSCLFLVFKKRKIIQNMDNKNIFNLIIFIYLIVYLFFLLLYPQTASHRFVNIVPLLFLFFDWKAKDLIISHIIFCVLLLGICIYGKNGIFPFIDQNNLFIGSILFSCIVYPGLFLLENKNNNFIYYGIFLSFPIFYFLLNGYKFHSLTILISYLLMFLVIIKYYFINKKYYD